METIALIILSFGAYFIVSFICFRFKITKISDALSSEKDLNFLNLRHLIGIIIFGLASYIYFQDSGITFQNQFLEDPALSLSIAFIATISMDLSISDAISQPLQIPLAGFSSFHGLLYLLIRLLFLFTYESFFRGVLFLFPLQYLSLPLAILLNLFFYALIHGFDSSKEILGSIPFGIILCLFTYYSGSIFPAFIIHASLSLGHEITIISRGLTKTQKS